MTGISNGQVLGGVKALWGKSVGAEMGYAHRTITARDVFLLCLTFLSALIIRIQYLGLWSMISRASVIFTSIR